MVSRTFKQISALLVLLLDKYSRQRDARQQFLAAQIEILRRRLKVDHVKLSPKERQKFLTFGAENHGCGRRVRCSGRNWRKAGL